MVRESLGSAKPPDRWTRAGIRRILPARRDSMDPNVKKTTLRMIPYGLYVLTAAHADGRISAGTVNSVTQGSFVPALVVVGVKTDWAGHAQIKDPKAVDLNRRRRRQRAPAFTAFRPAAT